MPCSRAWRIASPRRAARRWIASATSRDTAVSTSTMVVWSSGLKGVRAPPSRTRGACPSSAPAPGATSWYSSSIPISKPVAMVSSRRPRALVGEETYQEGKRRSGRRSQDREHLLPRGQARLPDPRADPLVLRVLAPRHRPLPGFQGGRGRRLHLRLHPRLDGLQRLRRHAPGFQVLLVQPDGVPLAPFLEERRRK